MTNMEQSQTYMRAYNTIVLCHFNLSALKNILSARMFEIHYELTCTHCQGLF